MSEVCWQLIRKNPVVVLYETDNFQNFDNYRKADTYLTTTTNLKESLEKWSHLEFFNPRAKFWFLTEANVTRQIFEILAKFYMINVALVTPLDQVYTYFPYRNSENVTKPDTTPFYLGYCQDVYPFFENLPKFWRNTTIKILTKCMTPYIDCTDDNIRGIEAEILNLIGQNLKFKVRHVIDKNFTFGLVKENGTYSASFRILQNREVDMTMGGFRSIGHTQYLDFDFATNHLEDKLVWVVPQAESLVHWIRIIKSFEWPFWLVLFVLTLTVVYIFRKLSQISKEPIKSPTRIVLVLLLGGHVRQTPKNLKMRILFIFWIYFTMLVNIVFNSNLINVFFANYNSFQINTFGDIVKSSLDIGLTDDVMQILTKDPDWTILTQHKDVLTCPFGTACLNRTITYRDLVCCWARRSITYRMALSYKKVHFVDDHLMFFLVLFYFVKGYPMVPQISRIITQLRSTGLVQHISQRVDQVRVEKMVDLGSKVLTFKRLEGPFYFLGSGWVLGCLVFLGEVFYAFKGWWK